MLKKFKYSVGDEVVVNLNADKRFSKKQEGKRGIITLLITGGFYDYAVMFDDIETGKFSQSELDRPTTIKIQKSFNKAVEQNGKALEKLEQHDVIDKILNVFMDQYKNEDDTYTIPSTVLISLIKEVVNA